MLFSRSEDYSVRYNTLFPIYRRLPWWLAYRLAASQAPYFQKKHTSQAEAIRQQMQSVFRGASKEQLDRWVADYFRMVEQEALDTWFLDSSKLPELVEMQGFETVEQLRARGKKVILTGGHYGRFWMAGPAMRGYGHLVGTITRDGDENNIHGLHPAEHRYRLFKLKKLSDVLGGPFLVEGGDLRPLYRELDRSLITLIFDVPYAESQSGSVTVPFLGGKIKIPAGVYKIAKKTEAVVVPFYIRDLQSGRIRVEFSEPLETYNYNDEEFMSVLAMELESRIKANPGFWWLWEALPLLWSKNNESGY